MIKNICLECGKEFEFYPSQKRKYCSQNCFYKNRCGNSIRRRDRRCPICGEALHAGKTYCSLKCYHKSSQFKEMLARRNPIKLKNNTSFKKGHMPWNKGKTNIYSEKALEKMSNHAKTRIGSKNPFYGKRHSEKTKMIVSKKAIERFKDLSYKEKIVKKLRNNVKPTKLELKFMKILEHNFPKQFKYVGDGKTFIAGLNPDYINFDKKLIIELLGCYWHGCQLCYPDLEQDDVNKRGEIFKKYNFKTLFIWEHDLKNKNLIMEKIREFLNV